MSNKTTKKTTATKRITLELKNGKWTEVPKKKRTAAKSTARKTTTKKASVKRTPAKRKTTRRK